MQNSYVRGTQNRVAAFCSRSQSSIPAPDSWINVLHSKRAGESCMVTCQSDLMSSKATLLWWLKKVQHQLLGSRATARSRSHSHPMLGTGLVSQREGCQGRLVASYLILSAAPFTHPGAAPGVGRAWAHCHGEGTCFWRSFPVSPGCGRAFISSQTL